NQFRSSLVEVLTSRAAPTGAAVRVRTKAASRLTRARTSLLRAPSGRRFFDRGDGQVGWRTPQGESYRVSHLDRLHNLRRGSAEAHRHGRHVAGDLAVRDDEQA